MSLYQRRSLHILLGDLNREHKLISPLDSKLARVTVINPSLFLRDSRVRTIFSKGNNRLELADNRNHSLVVFNFARLVYAKKFRGTFGLPRGWSLSRCAGVRIADRV